jgi:hypothetical protein
MVDLLVVDLTKQVAVVALRNQAQHLREIVEVLEVLEQTNQDIH